MSFILVIFSFCIMSSLCLNGTTQTPSSPCAAGCQCDPEKATCQNVTAVPNITIKGQLKSLTITKHLLGTLSADSFKGFTSLQILEVTDGNISTIAAGAFVPVSGTVTKIDLSDNELEVLPIDVFKDLNNLATLLLSGNRIKTIPAGSFTNLGKLAILKMVNNQLETIEKGAFSAVTELQSLDLMINNFHTLPLEGLDGLVGLQTLTLDKNKISSLPLISTTSLPALTDLLLVSNPLFHIRTFPNVSSKLENLDLDHTHIQTLSEETWIHLSSLKLLVLNSIKITTLRHGMFKGLDNLEILDMMNVDFLTDIGPDAFLGLKNIKTVDLRGSEALQSIDETAFISTPTLENLFISNCSLTYIPQHLAKWSSLKQAWVKGNPINCDCKMKWALDHNVFGDKTDLKNEFHNLTCASPEKLKNRKLGSLDPSEMVCTTLDDHKSRLTTGVIVAICCFVFMTTIAVLAANRKRLYLWCRRQYQYRRYKNDMVFTVEQDTSVAELDDQIEARPLKDLRLEQVPL